MSKITYKKLEGQLQQALSELNHVSVEKFQLENEYNECKNQCRDLSEVEKSQVPLIKDSDEIIET